MLQEFVKKRYNQIREHHESGATGEEITAALTDLTDEVIDRVYREVIAGISPGERWKSEDGVAVVALGGYGRGERSPHSDIDIMFLFRPSARKEVEGISGGVIQRLWDAGFEVGHSARTRADCIALGRKDLTVQTSMMEARYLNGNRELFDQFRSTFHRKVVRGNRRRFTREKIKGREADWDKYGTTTYLLEPHIKKSRGGLRDLHLFQWLSLVWHQTASFETLKRRGILPREDFIKLTEAREFIWKVRNEMHFNAQLAQDSLTFDEQVRLAKKWGYRDEGHLLGVERFMRDYYDHTTAIAEISGRYVKEMRARGGLQSLTGWLFRKEIAPGVLLSGGELSVRPESRTEIFSQGTRTLSLFHLAQRHRAFLSNEIQNFLNAGAARWPKDFFSGPGIKKIFFDILSETHGVARTLRELHRFRILEEILPGLKRVRALMQFNQYHKYTVDEHSLLAVEEAENLSRGDGRVSAIHNEIQSRGILYLALLSHDLGKGLVSGEHSEQGAEIALETAGQLGLDAEATEQLLFLVREHLLMTNIAFRRDISDFQVLKQFAEKVGTPDMLRTLYILTLADITAVGPGMLTAWKRDLLAELFDKTLKLMRGDLSSRAEEERVRRTRETVVREGSKKFGFDWVETQVKSMPQRYLLITDPEKILTDLGRIQNLQGTPARVFSFYDSSIKLTEYSVYTHEETTSGIFYRISSALASKGLEIIGAEIYTWGNGVVVDRFRVSDPDFKGAPPEFRVAEVRRAVVRGFEGDAVPFPAAGEGRYHPEMKTLPQTAPVRVEVDNSISDRYSVVEVYAPDRPGLLSAISFSLYKQGLSVQAARVATQLDQVVDVFHVTDRAGQALADTDKIRIFKASLIAQIENFLSAGRPVPGTRVQ